MKYPDFVVFPHVTVVHVQGLARTIHVQCIHGAFGREITKYTVTYGADIGFWPILHICTVYIWYFWHGGPQMYGHIRCVFITNLAHPIHDQTAHSVALS